MRLHRLRHLVPLGAALAFLLSGCADGAEKESPGQATASAKAPATAEEPRTSAPDRGRPWEPDDALQRAERALDAYDDDGSRPERAEAGSAHLASGVNKTFQAPGKRWYRLDITCDAAGVDELTLTLTRGSREQAYGIGCGDREADQFNIPPGAPFTARVETVRSVPGLVLWRLNTVAPGDVDGCADDIEGCGG
ncbi:hypothetical protein SAMN05428945_3908 [Streptomyces sp. 2224.1]|uniref:hypothetical protein n=1 Tax=unclassified Streptomyces TaxID=2593676 RepID=UPI0008915FDC|nr:MULTISPECIES: hypothetical protein [unclassified Streptomyces]PBC81553.1 hypothetical protein BX261_1429 [Streptomyces sp. 2321.6]SDR54339.1 hypothetical protein SAMN05216511_5787 [Streptomyces sp. KS_16]SEC20152.1 hypothetical protein SAMN05428940_1429 [Streptomyces sp. 2133.1]SED12256.1 hypothetical protein SAMN05428945_3908 [Streptomyces sp. 2224.1]SEF06948.1 hypothetical protein SAMN05428954_5850 [Streptomyces sp. 2112.3]